MKYIIILLIFMQILMDTQYYIYVFETWFLKKQNFIQKNFILPFFFVPWFISS